MCGHVTTAAGVGQRSLNRRPGAGAPPPKKKYEEFSFLFQNIK